MNLLLDINKEGKTVIIVTHDEKVASFCKRRIDILDCKIVSNRITNNEKDLMKSSSLL